MKFKTILKSQFAGSFCHIYDGRMVFIRKFFQGLFPTSCFFCKKNAKEVCPDCWDKLKKIQEPCCDACGLPYQNGLVNRLCHHCQQQRPDYDWHRSVFLFDDLSRRLVYELKRNGHLYLRDCIFNSFKQLDFPQTYDIICSVPLTFSVLRERGFNQADLLAGLLAKSLEISHEKFLVKKIRATAVQKNLGREERQKNLRDSFALTSGACVLRKNILVVDDVHTTGATLSEMARVLKKSGATHVGAVSLCLVPVR